MLDASKRRSRRFTADDLGWRAENEKIRVRVRTNSYGHPEFDWRELPTYMLLDNESRGGEFVLNTDAVERFLGDKITAPRWKRALWPRST